MHAFSVTISISFNVKKMFISKRKQLQHAQFQPPVKYADTKQEFVLFFKWCPDNPINFWLLHS